jgi:hypothetical protein
MWISNVPRAARISSPLKTSFFRTGSRKILPKAVGFYCRSFFESCASQFIFELKITASRTKKENKTTSKESSIRKKITVRKMKNKKKIPNILSLSINSESAEIILLTLKIIIESVKIILLSVKIYIQSVSIYISRAEIYIERVKIFIVLVKIRISAAAILIESIRIYIESISRKIIFAKTNNAFQINPVFEMCYERNTTGNKIF